MMEETKNGFIEIIENIEVGDNFKDPIVKFIKGYDGSNEQEFVALCYSLVIMLNRLNELGVKSDGYEELKIIEDNYNEVLDELRESYKAAYSGDILPELPIPATDDEYPVVEKKD